LSVLRDAKSELHKTLVEEAASKAGALEVAREIADLEQRKDDLEQKLRALGFDVDSDDGEVTVRYDAPDKLRRSIDGRVRKEVETEHDLEMKFDRGMVKLLAVDTAEEAAQIVEALL
jgi:hypothetical protein